MPRDRKVTVDELPVHPASPSGAAEAKGAGQDGAFGDFGAVAKELVSPPATPDLDLMAGMRLVASIQDTRLSLAARSATLSHSLALPAGELTGSIGITDGRQDPFLLSRAPAAMTLGLNLARDAPTHGAGLLSCAVEVDAAQRTGTVSSAMAFLGGRLKAGAAATFGDGRAQGPHMQSYRLGCEVGSAAAGLVTARCGGKAGAAPSALTLSMLAPPVALGAARPLSFAAEATIGSEGGRSLRVGAAVPLTDGVRAKVTADARGGCSFHLLLNEVGFGPWRRGARGLPPAFAVGATLFGEGPHGAAAASAGGAGAAVALALHPLRLVGERAVMLPSALSSAPLLISVEPGR